ncbi:hypothetical protein AD017_32085 (plasmid) [Pseudonocardia sp. EC080619-01]|nr:hypothetical protein AD017_32085 [Pseudonocardia sp. EC080619-01]
MTDAADDAPAPKAPEHGVGKRGTAAGSSRVVGGPVGSVRRLVAPVLVGVLLVLAVVAAATVAVSWRDTADAGSARAEIVDVSTRVVHDFIRIDADNAQANVDSMLGVATEPFRTELGRFSEVFGAILSQGQVKAEGGVDSIGIEQIDDQTATALVSASTTVRNTEVPDGAPRDFRLLLGLRHEEGAWKVSTVEVAP